MPKSDLAKYIEEVKKKGHPDHHIKHHLRSHGYPDHIIENAFKELEKKYDIALYVMIFFVGLFVLLLLFLGISSLAKLDLFGPRMDYCGNTSIFIRKYNEQEIICNAYDDKLKIDFLIFNIGADDISKVSFNVIGEKKKFKFSDETPELVFDTGYVKSYEYDKTKGGEIKSIQITPSIKDKKERLCKSKMIEITDFSQCTK